MNSEHISLLRRLIGRPYILGASGPDSFDCYGLARYIQRELAGIEMPPVVMEEPTTRAATEALLVHPERQAWGEVAEPQNLDLVLMGNVSKRDFHLGTYVVPLTTGVVIHTDKALGVVAHNVVSLKTAGFNYLRFFRRQQLA